ncbi:MAG: acylphosphatase [Streptococcaceae bacterium]|nr:acylphosphatase [Streptococcaceae bacterium]
MRKIRMNVKGVVQGVGFRYMTKRVADNLGVTGAVWNEDDGSVSIEALGTNETIELFIKMVKSSPSPSGMVNEASVEETPDLVFSSSFKVTYK